MLNFIIFYYRTTIIDYVFGLFLVRLYLLKKKCLFKKFFFHYYGKIYEEQHAVKNLELLTLGGGANVKKNFFSKNCWKKVFRGKN